MYVNKQMLFGTHADIQTFSALPSRCNVWSKTKEPGGWKPKGVQKQQKQVRDETQQTGEDNGKHAHLNTAWQV